MRLTASRRFDKCPTPGQRCSEKFPTAGTDKMTNAWGYIYRGDGHAWNLHVLGHKLLKNISGMLLCCKKKSQSGVRKLNHKQEL